MRSIKTQIITIGRVLAIGFVLWACEASEAQTLHAILIGDTIDERIGSAVDLKQVAAMLREGIPRKNLNLTVIDGFDVNNENVLSHLRRIRAASDDAIFVFYSGHGGYSENGQQHYFLFPREKSRKLSRQRILEEMQSHNPRLSVLISDCCANYLPVQRTVEQSLMEPGRERLYPLMDSLFFRSSGVVNLTSSRIGQLSMGNENRGGLFTHSLTQVVSDHAFDQLSWKEVFHKTRLATSRGYHSYAVERYNNNEPLDQFTQTAWAFSTWNGEEINGTRLGIGICKCGKHVRTVEPGGPADKAGVTPGAKLLTYNGAEIQSQAHLLRLVRESSLSVNIMLEDKYGRRELPAFWLAY